MGALGTLNRIFNSLANREEEQQSFFKKLYVKYKTHTMIPEDIFLNNLKLIIENRLNGDVVECGVWKGGMIAAIAELLGNSYSFHLFDSFEGLPKAQEIDGKAAMAWQDDVHSDWYFDNCTAEEKFVVEAMNMAGLGVRSYNIHKGWFENTLPNSVDKINPIAYLRLDGDWFSSTMTCLTYLYPKVIKGGLIIVDDYKVWDGCSRAVHQYLNSINSQSRIRELNNSVIYIEKND